MTWEEFQAWCDEHDLTVRRELDCEGRPAVETLEIRKGTTVLVTSTLPRSDDIDRDLERHLEGVWQSTLEELDAYERVKKGIR